MRNRRELTLSPPDRRWFAEAHVLNLTNKMSKNSAGDAGGFIKATWNDPRMFGVTFRVDY